MDDHHYVDGVNCPREGKVIKECLESNPKKQRVWFLRPKNDSGSCLFDESRDYSTMLDYSKENEQEIVRKIEERLMNDREEQ